MLADDEEWGHEVIFWAPTSPPTRLVWSGDFTLKRGVLTANGQDVYRNDGVEPLGKAVSLSLPGASKPVSIRVRQGSYSDRLVVEYGGVELHRENELKAPTSRSAWRHGWIALFASFAGFFAGYLYMLRSQELADPWANKMAYHMIGWHLLLTVSLFPASVAGQRVGIRSVQVISGVFFLIHLAIAIANVQDLATMSDLDLAIASMNALSGFFFAWSVLYGQKAYVDMDPVQAFLRTQSET